MYFAVGCLEKNIGYPANDIDKKSGLTLETCEKICRYKSECKVFTYTRDENDPANGTCRIKSSRGPGPVAKNLVDKNKISGSGTTTCPGIFISHSMKYRFFLSNQS